MTAIAAPTSPDLAGHDRDTPVRTAPGAGVTLLRGLLGGIALGAAFRAWMRLVSTDPSFTWSGTLFIVGLVTAVVLLASITSTVRARARRRWVRGVVRLLSVLAFGLLGAGPGAITVPVWLLGGLAWGRRTWPTWARALLAVGAAAGVVGLVVATTAEVEALGLGRYVLAIVAYVPLMAVIAWLFAIPTGSVTSADVRT